MAITKSDSRQPYMLSNLDLVNAIINGGKKQIAFKFWNTLSTPSFTLTDEEQWVPSLSILETLHEHSHSRDGEHEQLAHSN